MGIRLLGRLRRSDLHQSLAKGSGSVLRRRLSIILERFNQKSHNQGALEFERVVPAAVIGGISVSMVYAGGFRTGFKAYAGGEKEDVIWQSQIFLLISNMNGCGCD